ncbi:phosphoribosylglycinamide formyltransferase [Granulicella sp. WH15]|uniref:phosphoribosylglycinamide formyltransferase n=1 Tax=Granulicella sp. WH15 TaxID=2602070 RepID=UPI0013675F11|nr:phosphoribosylglycinamide formyltransferase [Granulicella sp. WH15]QHN02146.1 phosphoribosylglycinamide formyltransferase [Granulicella sp. WH15]
MVKLGILLSGRGSNFLAIAEAIREGGLPGVEIAVVLSNRAAAPGLEAARALGIPSFAIPAAGLTPEERDQLFIARLREFGVDLVCLAGYMRLVSPGFVAAFPDRILNVHPSLLPAFPGLNAQGQALEFGVKVTGCTVHFVDEHLDHGVIVLQRTVPVEDGDTEETLSARVLVQEHQAYAEAIGRVVSGEYQAVGRRYLKVSDRHAKQ